MEQNAARLLLVDDDPTAIRVMGRILEHFPNQCFATSGADALRLAREQPPDLVLLDAEMPGMSGFDVIASLKDEPALVDVPVIFVTSHYDPLFEVTGFELGAADFIKKPVNASLLLARVHAQLRIKSMADELRRLCTIDHLTGITNRRKFDLALHTECSRGSRSHDPVSLLLVDIDHFKLFNDHYGHPRGDACLRSVAGALASACLRPADVVARFGGEEFAILLPETGCDGAEHIARRVLDAVSGLRIPHVVSPTAAHVTVSVGLSCFDDPADRVIRHADSSHAVAVGRQAWSAGDLAQSADRALYSAKRAGRAQVRMLEVAHGDTPYRPRAITALGDSIQRLR